MHALVKIPAILRASLATALLATAPTLAQPVSDAERCASISGNPDLAIQHCTRAIESGKFTGELLGQLHYNRGVEWAAKSDYNRAIADYDLAIKLNPRSADAYYNRGNAWGSKGDPDRAIADYDAAIKLNPKDAASLTGRAFEWTAKGDYPRAIADYDTALKLDPKSSGAVFARGRTRFYSGDFPRAVADFEQAMKLDPNEYTAMWLYLARKRGNLPNAEEMLDTGTRTLRTGSWPTPVIVLYLGRTDADSVLAASTDQDARKQREQRCEAQYYLAQWHLLRNEADRALPLLKEAQAGCPRDFLEHEGATAELRRLQKP
jgi:lipoprotein NlpI